MKRGQEGGEAAGRAASSEEDTASASTARAASGEASSATGGAQPDATATTSLGAQLGKQLGAAILGVAIAAVALAFVISLLGSAGCYQTPTPECGFTCGANASCPSDYVCGSNNRCRLPSASDEDCPGVSPATGGMDARMDAPADGGTDAPPPACVDLMPASDGTGRQQLLLSELSPTAFIELYNPTDADLSLAQGDWGLQARAVTFFLKDLAPAVTVPAHGYAHFPWPAALLASDAGGELALYSGVAAAADFDDGMKLVGYACWGTDAELARKQLAEDSGKWSGDCAAALARSALRRKVATQGIAAADFVTDGAAEQTACDPTP